jgi:hypothetical protein
MRIVSVLGVVLADLSVFGAAFGAVTAYGQLSTHSKYGGAIAASLTTREIRVCPPIIGPPIRCWTAGEW